MDIDYEYEFSNNDIEYKKGLSSIKNTISNIIEEPPITYNSHSFESKVIIHYFQNKNLLKNIQYFNVYRNAMNICKKSNAIDKLVCQFHKRKPAHDIKIRITKCSFFEPFQIKIQIFYFLLLFCFVFQKILILIKLMKIEKIFLTN